MKNPSAAVVLSLALGGLAWLPAQHIENAVKPLRARKGAAPGVPANLAVTLVSSTSIGLTWTAAAGAAGYTVYRNGSVARNVLTAGYVDTRLTPSTTYSYTVAAYDSNGALSAQTAPVTATTKPSPVPPGTPFPIAPVTPAAPTGLATSAGISQVILAWNASSGATSYNVKRSTTSGSGYVKIGSPTANAFTDSAGLTNGATYYYVVSAVNSAGESANSAQTPATPLATVTTASVAIDALANRHTISPYVYGGSYPKNAAAVTDAGLSVVRWGGDATSTYNWQTQTYNAAADYYFEDYTAGGYSSGNTDSDSIQFVKDIKAAGANPLMTMVMLPWVAKSAEVASPANNHWSFSVAKYGAQCSTDYWNADAGNGIVNSATCSSSPTYLTANPNDAYVPLLDDHTVACSTGSTCVYRSDWAAALATAFGTAPHFYDMDNEIDIWGGTHRDIHPAASGYEELRDVYLSEARALKTWDPAAIRLGPVSCCWWFYWNGANGNDKTNHAGIDFLPWWLNEVYWRDQIAGTQSVDVVDLHAYPDAPSESTLAQQQALATRIYRDYWDPTYVSESSSINQPWTTQIQPNKTIPFRIPRMRALANMIYPGLPLAFTEWSAEIAGAADFSTALGDADAYGILGRERIYLASRWTAADPANANYQALKLYTNYDGQHHGFAPISIAATNTGNANLLSSFAAVTAAGTSMTVMIINKDPMNSVQLTLGLNGFTPAQETVYTLSQSSPTAIVASAAQAWSSVQTFAPYTATLLVISGSMGSVPGAEWDLNPDTIMVPANGTVTLSPRIISGASTVVLGTPQADSGITVSVANGTLSAEHTGTVTITAGGTPGFYHYTAPGTDTNTTTRQSGYIIVGNPAATFTETGNSQTGTHGTTLATPLAVILAPGASGGTASGASVLFSTTAGTLSNGTTTGTKVIAVTNASGIASVTLTLPGAAGSVTVTAEGPYALGHPVATFTETAQ